MMEYDHDDRAAGFRVVILCSHAYNLGVLSYLERYREFATMKVPGLEIENPECYD